VDSSFTLPPLAADKEYKGAVFITQHGCFSEKNPLFFSEWPFDRQPLVIWPKRWPDYKCASPAPQGKEQSSCGSKAQVGKKEQFIKKQPFRAWILQTELDITA